MKNSAERTIKKMIDGIRDAGPNLKRWGLYFLVMFLCYMMFMHPIITSDFIPGYATHLQPKPLRFEDIVSGGRFINLLIVPVMRLLALLGVTHYQNTYVWQLIGIAQLAAAAVLLYEMLVPHLKDDRRKHLLDAAVLLVFIHPLMIEAFGYGLGDWGFGIFLAVVSAKRLCNHRIISGIVLGWAAVSVYQTNAMVILIICYVVLFLDYVAHEYDIVFFIKWLFGYGAAAVTAALSNIFLQRLLTTSLDYSSPMKNARIWAGFGAILYRIYRYMLLVWFGFFSHFPRYSVFVFVGILILLVAAELLLHRKKTAAAAAWLMLSALCCIIPFSYCIVFPYVVPRTMLSIFFAIGLIFAVAVCLTNGKIAICTCILGLAFCTLDLFCTETAIADAYIGQALDAAEAKTIQEEINYYEEQTGIKVQHIVTVGNKNGMEYTYRGLQLVDYYDTIFAHRIMYDEWARGAYINYVNGTSYEYREMTEEEYEQHFGDTPSGGFSPSRQMVFDEETLFLLIH